MPHRPHPLPTTKVTTVSKPTQEHIVHFIGFKHLAGYGIGLTTYVGVWFRQNISIGRSDLSIR